MSGVKDAYVSVRQSQVNAWNSARWQAEQAARESAALQEQQRRIEQRQQADASEFSRQLNLQAQSQRRAMDELGNRLDANIRTEIERQGRVEDAKRADLARRIQNDMEERERRIVERDRATNARIDTMGSSIDALSERIGVTERRIEEVDADLRAEIGHAVTCIRLGMGEMEENLRTEINARTSELDARLTETERWRAVIECERETARQYSQGFIDSCEALIEDLDYRREDCERFYPTELDALHRRYNDALAMMRRGFDPVAGVVSLNETIIAATELRSRVIYRRSQFDMMRYDYLGIITEFEAMSAEDYRVPSTQEGFLFTLDEMSRGELAQFREQLAGLRRRIESGTCTPEDLASIREDIKHLPDIYSGIVERAVYFESASEEVRTQSRNLVDRFTEGGFRFEGAMLRGNQSTMLVFSCRAGDGLMNRIVLEVTPHVASGKDGSPEIGYSYRQRVFVLDAQNHFLTGYDPGAVQFALRTIEAATGAHLETSDGRTDGVAATEEDYADVATAFSAASGEGAV